jgi:hypothetical protein
VLAGPAAGIGEAPAGAAAPEIYTLRKAARNTKLPFLRCYSRFHTPPGFWVYHRGVLEIP